MRIAVDTGVLAYAEGVNDADRKRIARATLGRVVDHEFVLPVQAEAELFSVLVRKLRVERAIAGSMVGEWSSRARYRPATTDHVLAAAVRLATLHDLRIFDAIILIASAEAGCRMLLSEDMQDGVVWRGVTVVNPFAATLHPLLADLMRA